MDNVKEPEYIDKLRNIKVSQEWIDLCKNNKIDPWKIKSMEGTLDYNTNLLDYINKKRFTFDEKGNCIHIRYNRLLEQWFEYDEKGNCVYSKDSCGEITRYEYDERNNLIHSKDDDGYEMWYTYDKDNRCIQDRNEDGYETIYDYDEKGNLIHLNHTGTDMCESKISEGEFINSICRYYQIYEIYYEYDEFGNCTMEKDISEDGISETHNKFYWKDDKTFIVEQSGEIVCTINL
jgi:YD repeat-containing protein